MNHHHHQQASSSPPPASSPPAAAAAAAAATMFLTESEVNAVLQNSMFSSPVTESDVTYAFYRGMKQANLLTIRFNMIPSFQSSFMVAYLQDKLTSAPYQLQSRILISVHYDLLLCNVNATPKTYYIWRSNTNRTTLNVDHQLNMTISYANIERFCENVTTVSLSDLDSNFISSDVTVDRVLAIVFAIEH